MKRLRSLSRSTKTLRDLLPKTQSCADDAICLILVQLFGPLRDAPSAKAERAAEFGSTAAENLDCLLLGKCHGSDSDVERTRHIVCQAT